MTSDLWSTTFTAQVAHSMREARKAAGLTMPAVAERCAERGLPEITDQTIKNLESGRRTSITLTDFFALADSLGVPPVALLFPLGTTETVEVLPGREVSTWDALAWFTGETPITEPAPPGSPRDVLDTFREHGDLVAAARASAVLATDRRRAANTTPAPARRAALLELAAGYEEYAEADRKELSSFRTRMRERGLVPPALPDGLTGVDQTADEGRIEDRE
ncbi:helix-turn-helix domain-containing protein [Kitasatospora mediocidica]|uniref:helix-turn-helix domain-containing protein n=1 Tax=Kitasatospora mediocidica TaxID=58352 RepID=UPI00056708E4|nr:helix-turn-helix transcriptional regulator [Kitasatospora mediocidica]